MTLPDDYDPNKPGEYDITFTRTNEIGASVTTTKKLTVLDRKEWTPIIPAPVLEVEDKTIRVGTKFSESEDLKEYGVVIVNYVDEDGLPIKNSIVNSVKLFTSEYDTTKDKPETIEFNGKKYELVKVKDGDLEQGTIEEALTQVTYVYKLKEGSSKPEIPGEDPKPETPEDPKPSDPKPETPKDLKPSDPKPSDPKPETPGEELIPVPKPETPEKPEETDKLDTKDKTEIENEDNDISSDKLRVPSPSTSISSNNQVSSPTRSVVTKSSDKGASNNVKTGVSGAISVASILAVAGAGLYATRNKENEEE